MTPAFPFRVSKISASVFPVLKLLAFPPLGFKDSGFCHSGFEWFRLFPLRVLYIPAFAIGRFQVINKKIKSLQISTTDPYFSTSLNTP